MIKCIFVGDVMPGSNRIEEKISPDLAENLAFSDFIFGNLESPFVRKTPSVLNLDKIPLWSTAENLTLLKQLKFTHFCLNNNHIYDLYENGLDDSIELLYNAGFAIFGLNYKGISQLEIVEKYGIRLGVIAFNWVQSQFSNHLFKDANEINLKKIKKSVDFLICFLHWGDDHNIFINMDQQKEARKLIDQGVDLIIGSHPHVPQGWEKYKEKYIFYSLGNFIFTPKEKYSYLPYKIRYDDQRENILFQRKECKIGLYVSIQFDKRSYKLLEVKPIYRQNTLPCILPAKLNDFYLQMKKRMNSQIKDSNFSINDNYKKKILIKYTIPLIFKNPLYWPIFLKKLTSSKSYWFFKNIKIP